MNLITPPAEPAASSWNRRFGADGFLFGDTPNKWLSEHAHAWSPGDRVLAVADGEGRNSVWLAGRGLVVDAFDLSEVGVAKARSLAATKGVNVNFAVADCDTLAWPSAQYDGVAAIFVQFADPAMRERLFANIIRSLKPKATLILLGYTPRQHDYRTGGPAIASHLYTEPMLRHAFAALDIVKLHEYDDDLEEGSAHRGRSALIGLVATKR